MTSDKKAAMNEELQEWANEKHEEIRKLDDSEDFSKKKPEGKCQICGEKTATAVCIKCGRSVCNSCYFKLIGICKKCVPQDIAGKWDGSRTDWEKELGVEWVD